MKLSVSFIAFAAVLCSVCGKEEHGSTFLRGSDSDALAAASKEKGRAPREREAFVYYLPDWLVDPQEHKVRSNEILMPLW